MPAPFAHHFEVLAVIIHMDVARFGNAVDQSVVKRPIHVAEDNTAIGDVGEASELVKRRNASRTSRHFKGAAAPACRASVRLLSLLCS